MRYAYPAILEPEEGGGFVVSFPDVPEALTGGDDRAESLALGADALATALAGYINDRRDIPVPSARGKHQVLVALPPVAAAKLALYSAMRDQGVSQVALAGRLGVTEGAVRKLLNLDQRSHIDRVEAALTELGREMVLEVRDAA